MQNIQTVRQITEAEACDKPYRGPLWKPNQGLLIVLESNYDDDEEKQAWMQYFLAGGYDATFGVLIDCIMCAGEISRRRRWLMSPFLTTWRVYCPVIGTGSEFP